MKKLASILFLFGFIVSANAATVYKGVDKEGVENFTDDYKKVPPLYRDRVEELEVPRETPLRGPSTPPARPIEKREGILTDTDGRDETWWRDKVRPWKEQLKEATNNYEKSHKQLMEQVQTLAQWRFGSLTQYQMIANRVGVLNSQLTDYQAKITEAKEMLEKLSKEAEESRANPEWLK